MEATISEKWGVVNDFRFFEVGIYGGVVSAVALGAMGGGSGFFVTLLIDVATKTGAESSSKETMRPP